MKKFRVVLIFGAIRQVRHVLAETSFKATQNALATCPAESAERAAIICKPVGAI